MTTDQLEKLKYPIGKFKSPESITQKHLDDWIGVLETLPSKVAALVSDLNEAQLKSSYRPGGWNIRELVHHLADSHHNSYTRFKWTLTEHNPVIKAYDENLWAQLIDTQTAPIELSVSYLYALHAKLVYLLKRLTAEQLERIFIHPDDNSRTSLKENMGKYAWHSEHHLKHIEIALAKV